MIAYEIVTGKVPFSELGNKISAVYLGIKVTDGNRPSFPKFVPEKTQKLIRRCWSENVRQRPSLEEIFNELSSDFSYLGEDVDEYLSFLGESKSDKSTDLFEENEELQKELSEIKKKLTGYTVSEEFLFNGLVKLQGTRKRKESRRRTSLFGSFIRKRK